MEYIDIIVPVFNEQLTIRPFIRGWDAQLHRMHIPHRFIIVEDGSTDDTYPILRRLAKKYPILLIHEKSRRGYGPAKLAGIQKAAADYLLHIDADGQYVPEDFASLWNQRARALVVVGARIRRADPWFRKLNSFLFFLLFRLLFFSPRRDPSSPFVLYRRSALSEHLAELAYCNESFWWGFSAMCLKRRISVAEIPVRHLVRIDGKSRVYSYKTLPWIVLSNAYGLFRLRFAA